MTDAVRTLQSSDLADNLSNNTTYDLLISDLLKKYESSGVAFAPNDVKYLLLFAKEMHERWKDGLNGATAVRSTTDINWLKNHESPTEDDRVLVGKLADGTQGAIISNCTFDELPLDWKLENIQDLLEAFKIVQEFYKSGRNINSKNIQEVSKLLHTAWVERTIARTPERESQIEKDYDKLSALYLHRNNAYRLEMARDMLLRLRFLNGGITEIKDRNSLRQSMQLEVASRKRLPVPVGYPEEWGNPNLSKMTFTDQEISTWVESDMRGEVLIQMILQKSGKTLSEVANLNNDTGLGFSIYPIHDNLIKKQGKLLTQDKWKIRSANEYIRGIYPEDIIERLKSGVNIPLSIDPRSGELTFYQGFYWDPGLNFAGDAVLAGATIVDGRLAFSVLTIDPAVFPGYKAIPGGMVESGDIQIKGAIANSTQLRELYEETHVQISPECRVPGTELQRKVVEGRGTLTNVAFSEAFVYLIPIDSPFEINATPGDDALGARMQVANSDLFKQFHSPTHVEFVQEAIKIFEQQNPGLVVGEDGYIYLTEGVEINKVDGELMLKTGYRFDSVNGKVVSIESEEFTKNLKVVEDEAEAYASFRNIIGENSKFNKNIFELFNSEYTSNLKVWGQTTITNLTDAQLTQIKQWAESGFGKGKFFVKVLGKDVIIERAFYKSAPKKMVRLYVPEKLEDRRALIRAELSNLLESEENKFLFEDLRGVVSLIGGASLISAEKAGSIDRRLQDILVIVQQKLNGKFAVVDGGTDTGVMKSVGNAERRLNGMLTSIGVSPLGGMTNWFAPLNTQHDLSLVLNNCNDFGEETEFMMILISELINLMNRGSAFTILANGGKITVVEAFSNVREGRKVLVLSDSGRTCDLLETMLAGNSVKIGATGRETLAGDDTKNLNEIVNQLLKTYNEQGFADEITKCIVSNEGKKIMEFDISRSPVILERLRQDFIVAKGSTMSELEADVNAILSLAQV